MLRCVDVDGGVGMVVVNDSVEVDDVVVGAVVAVGVVDIVVGVGVAGGDGGRGSVVVVGGVVVVGDVVAVVVVGGGYGVCVAVIGIAGVAVGCVVGDVGCCWC